jgi:hypothetical protein
VSLKSFLDRDKRHGNSSYRRAPKQEKQLALRIKGQRISGSGSGPVKGDVRRRRVVRIEAKTTWAASFRVTLEMVNRLEDAALAADELPIMVIEFNNKRGRPLKEIIVAPSYVLDEICDARKLKS